MSKASEEFTSKLSILVSLNLPKATSMLNGRPPDEELATAMITQLVQQLGFVVAGVCHGDEKKMATLLEGLSQLVFEATANYNKTFHMMKQFQWKGPGRFPGDTGGEPA